MQRAVDTTEGRVFPEDDAVAASDSETARPETGRAPASPWPGFQAAGAGYEVPALSLCGDLRTMVLADVLLWIASRRKTGTLHVRRRATRKRLVFQEGVLHSSSSNDPRETLGQFLVRDGLITEEQLFKALLRQEEKGALLGILLVSEGLLSADQLKRTLRAKAEQIVYDLFYWGEGGFYFKEGLLPKNVPMNLEMDTPAVVQEGTRRAGRWGRIRQKFPSSDVTFTVGTGAQAPANPIEHQIFDLAAAGKTLAAISLETRRCEFDTAEHLFSLVELNVLRVDRLAPESEATDAVAAIQGLLDQAGKALAEKRYDAAFEAYQDALALDHLNQEAKKGLIAVSDARKRQRLARRVPHTAVPVLVLAPAQLANEKLSAEERFLIARVNGKWDVQSILKLCPLAEEDGLALLARLIDRKVIDLKTA